MLPVMIEHIKDLKYYLIYSVVVIGFFTYSALVGWEWLGGTATEHTPGEHGTRHHTGGHYIYHK